MRDTRAWKIRQLQVLSRLIDGRTHRQRAFADLYEGMHVKTFRRDLQAWVDTPEAQVQTGTDEHGKWWRMKVPTPTVPTLRVCAKCPERGPQPSTNFYRDRTQADGLRGECKDCNNERRREWWAKNGKRVNAYRRRKRWQVRKTNEKAEARTQ